MIRCCCRMHDTTHTQKILSLKIGLFNEIKNVFLCMSHRVDTFYTKLVL